MPEELILEVAVDSLERAAAAERNGADRLELCANLELGGVTPTIELIGSVRRAVAIPIHVMLRLRPGDFVYTEIEYARMREQVPTIRELGVQGLVMGILLPDNSIDVSRTWELVAFAAPLEVTFHRAFDQAPDPARSLEDVILSGARRVLTSGGSVDALQGAPALRQLAHQAEERILILPGGGLHAANIADAARQTDARELHTGLGTAIPYRSHDLKKFAAEVRACKAALKGLNRE